MSAIAEAPDFAIELPEVEKATTAYVFNATDQIAADVKTKVPEYRVGGVLKPNAKGLSYNLGLIPRCEITEVRQAFESVAAINVNPVERKHMTKTYRVREEGVAKQMGTRKAADGSIVHDGLLRSPLFPQDEVNQICSDPSGVADGTVQMPVRNRAGRDAAMAFLFPGNPPAKAPRNLNQLRSYFISRFDVAQDKFEQDVASAAILSVDQADAYMNQKVEEANATREEHRAKGWPYSYGPITNLYFEQLGVARPDNLERSQQEKIEEIAKEQRDSSAMMAQVLSRMTDIMERQAPAAPVEVQSDNLSPEVVPSIDSITEVSQCIAPTKAGPQCKNEAEPGTDVCRMHN